MNSSPIWSMSLLKGGNLETDRFTWKKCEPCKHSDSSLQAWDGSFPRTSEGTQPAYTLLQTTSLQNCEITDFCSVSHSVCGSSLWHPWQINTSAFLPPGEKMSVYISSVEIWSFLFLRSQHTIIWAFEPFLFHFWVCSASLFISSPIPIFPIDVLANILNAHTPSNPLHIYLYMCRECSLEKH